MQYIKLRLNKLLQKIEGSRLDALFVTHAPNVSYISGFRNRDAWLVVSSKGCYLLTDFRYIEEAQKEISADFKIVDTKQPFFNAYSALADVLRCLRVRQLGFEGNYLSFAGWKRLKSSLSEVKLIPTADLIEDLRMLKDIHELRLLKTAAKIAAHGMSFVSKRIRTGRTERQIAQDLDYFLKSHGADRASFDIIVASGPNSSMPHAITSRRRLKTSELALVDAGARFKGYNSDLTRTFFSGRMTRKAKDIYNIVDEAQKSAIAGIKPGKKASDIDNTARSVIENRGFGRYFGHGLGHGVGLEVHEKPRIAKYEQLILKEGMVFTVEPAVYIPGWGGVRIEDMVLVTKNGCKILTKL